MCDCDLPKCMTEIWRTARKPHVCCECQEGIGIGESYQLITGVWDRPQSFKSCQSCVDARSEYESWLYPIDCKPCLGKLWDDILADYSGTRQEWLKEMAA
jgi:hypothetical protein